MLERASRTAVAVVAAAASVLAAGCGGSPSVQPRTGQVRTRALAYASCLRGHGVPRWPDPNGQGVFDKSRLTVQQLGVSGGTVDAAQAACRHLLPDGGSGPDRSQVQRMRAQGLRFARCVRAHGVASFPDPGSDGRIPDPAASGVDQGSPAFRAANVACAQDRPPYIPANAAYGAWARTHGGGSR